MTTAEIQKLRAAFTPDQIGKLPKPTKKENPKGRCNECGGWHGLPAIHLDYVGHAAVTDRIISVDPDYEFGPVLDINKRPVKESDGSVLHYLTICGSTKYEWGDGPNMKEISSDAIRRCAMRFGVALDLWAKEPLAGSDDSGEAAAAPGTPDIPPSPARRRGKLRKAQIEVVTAAKDADIDDDLRHRITSFLTGKASVHDLDDEECARVVKNLAYFQMNRVAALEELAKWEAAQ